MITNPNTLNKIWLITGGTGSFGQAMAKILLERSDPKVIRIFSRGELLQLQMEQKFYDDRLRFFIGDVRDKDRLSRAMTGGVDIVVHAAALKHIPACEYNPIEAIQTNIIGAVNVVEAALNNSVDRVIAISSDKACAPVNTYGVTKACMEKLFTQANVYARKQTKFCCVRYGNVVGSRGSVIPVFKEQSRTGTLTLTDSRMTRFWITLEQGVHFVLNCLDMMRGGEIFIPKIPSMLITDLAEVIAPKAKQVITGIRPGEKLHEVLVTEDEARHTREFEDCFVIVPQFKYWTEDTYWDLTGNPLPEGFRYASDTNIQWLTKNKLYDFIVDITSANIGEIIKKWK